MKVLFGLFGVLAVSSSAFAATQTTPEYAWKVVGLDNQSDLGRNISPRECNTLADDQGYSYFYFWQPCHQDIFGVGYCDNVCVGFNIPLGN